MVFRLAVLMLLRIENEYDDLIHALIKYTIEHRLIRWPYIYVSQRDE